MKPFHLTNLISVSVLIVGFAAGSAQAQCVRLNDDVPGKCGDSGCVSYCAMFVPKIADSFNPLSPGFLTVQSEKKLLVSKVIPHSPAAEAGLRTGDELVSVDDSPVPIYDNAQNIWQKVSVHRVTIRRNDQMISFMVKPVPQNVLLTRNMASSGIIPAGLTQMDKAVVPSGAYLSGLIMGHGPRVSGVIVGSPAEAANIFPGDAIGFRATEYDPFEKKELETSERRATLRLWVSHSGRTRKVDLRMIAATELLERLPASQGESPRVDKAASLKE
jgi:hypothetical protein